MGSLDDAPTRSEKWLPEDFWAFEDDRSPSLTVWDETAEADPASSSDEFPVSIAAQNSPNVRPLEPIFDDFLPAQGDPNETLDAWSQYVFPTVADVLPGPTDVFRKLAVRKTLSQMVDEICATMPVSQRSRRARYRSLLGDYLESSAIPFLAFRSMMKAFEGASGDLVLDAVAFRLAWENCDLHWRREIARGNTVTIVSDRKGFWWGKAVKAVEVLEGADPEELLCSRVLEAWLRCRSTTRGYWRFLDYAVDGYRSEHRELQYSDPADLPPFGYRGPPIVRTRHHATLGGIFDTVVTTTGTGWRTRQKY